MLFYKHTGFMEGLQIYSNITFLYDKITCLGLKLAVKTCMVICVYQ